MTRGIWALCERALRLDARHLGGHFLRLGVVGLVYAALLILVAESGVVGAPGRRFLLIMAYLNVVVLSISGVRMFASVLTEEKEDGTLPLMMLTGLSPLAILLGKSTSRLLQVLLLIVVQLPLALFAVTLGGVTLGQILAAIVAIAAYVVCLANFGLLCSVLCRRSGDASGMAVVWLLMYVILLPLAGEFANGLQLYGNEWTPDAWEPALIAGLRFASEQSVILRLAEVFESRFVGGPWCWQVATNLLFGIGCFLIGWWLFPLANRDPGTETTPRRLVQAATTSSPRGWRTAGRPWSNPLTWLAFHFDAGGWPVIVLKFAAYGGLFFLLTWMQTDGFRDPIRRRDLFGTWAGTLSFLLVVEALIHGGRIFQNEYKAGTWSTLLTLPRSVAYLGYSKVWGAVLSMIPGALGCALLWCITAVDVDDIREVLRERGFWTFLLVLAWLVNFVTWLSAYRRQSQAMLRLVGVGCAGFLFVAVVRLVDALRWDVGEDEVLFILNTSMIATVAAMHWSMGVQLSRDEAA